MRIEKISDKQIRCTLTQADLQNHHINIGELAYGSEKARSLFQEMLSQASREFNFHAENMPLMIEAVPMSGDNLVLVITKVEDPDEIDTRFSKFSPAIDDDDFSGDFADIEAAFGDTKADEIIEEFKRLCEQQAQLDDEPTDPAYISEPDFFRVLCHSCLLMMSAAHPVHCRVHMMLTILYIRIHSITATILSCTRVITLLKHSIKYAIFCQNMQKASTVMQALRVTIKSTLL